MSGPRDRRETALSQAAAGARSNAATLSRRGSGRRHGRAVPDAATEPAEPATKWGLGASEKSASSPTLCRLAWPAPACSASSGARLSLPPVTSE